MPDEHVTKRESGRRMEMLLDKPFGEITTPDDTHTELLRYTVPTDGDAKFILTISGRSTVSTETYWRVVEVAVQQAATSISIIDTEVELFKKTSAGGAASWDAAISTDFNDLVVTVTGDPLEEVFWRVDGEVRVIYPI